jgi:1,4-dihydroxy-2-naphthoate octaprenyltransferase
VRDSSTVDRPAVTARTALQAGLRLSRPYFLAGTVPLYLVGVALAVRDSGDLHPAAAGLGLALVWSVQLLTHFYNEYYDLETDRGTAGSRITGGSGVLVEGGVPPITAVWLGRLAGGVALALTAALLALPTPGPALLAIVAVALLGGWTYSSPPLRLVARGLGAAVIVFLASVLVPLTGYYLQLGTIGPELALPVLTLLVLNTGLVLATALPDIEGDLATSKRTLAARLGPRWATWLAAGTFLLGCGVGTWTVGWLYPGAELVGIIGTALVAALAAPFVRPASRGDQTAAGRFALVLSAGFGAVAFVLAGAALLGP